MANSLLPIEKILASYQLSATRIHPPQSGYRNTSWPLERGDSEMANLIIYKAEPGILAKVHAANAVSNYLAGEGFPTRRTLDSRILTLKSAAKTTYASLYDYLPGETIPWEAYTQDHLKALGEAMGRMHQALSFMPASAATYLPNIYVEFGQITTRMRAYFARPEVQAAMRDKLDASLNPKTLIKYRKLLEFCTQLPHAQALHMDFVRGNLLFAPHTATITGILDFEKTALGHPVADIARTLAFLLVDCDKPEAKVRKYFLQSGYVKRGNSHIRYVKLLEPLTNLFLTYDLYKFLRHNPYESLGQNHHFVRTRDLLRRRGMIE